MQLIFPPPRGGSDVMAVPGTDRWLGHLYAYPGPEWGQPWLRANMISSADGAASLAGRSGGLSGAADRRIFTVLRSLADVILVGAGTARAERYRPVQPDELIAELRPPGALPPPIAVISGRLDLGEAGAGLLAGGAGTTPSIVLTGGAAPPARRAAVAQHAELIVTGPEQVTAPAAVAALAGRGYRRILTEGGPGLLAQIAAAGLLDELCLTYSPLLAGGNSGRILAAAGTAADGPLAELDLTCVIEDEGYLLCRYRRPRKDT